MAEGLVTTLLITLLILYAIGWFGLFVFTRFKEPEKIRKTRIKYFVYLIIVLLLVFLIRYSISAYRIVSFAIIGIGFIEILRVLVSHYYKLRLLGVVISLVLFLSILVTYSGFLFLDPVSILFLYLVVSAFDGFSQVAGSVFGKHMITGKVSPNKTLEGLIGGVIVSLIPAIIIGYYQDYSFKDTFINLMIILPSAFLGDYLASFLKRRASIKDYSGIIPGHGGVLDRFDSHFMAGAVYYLFSLLLLNS